MRKQEKSRNITGKQPNPFGRSGWPEGMFDFLLFEALSTTHDQCMLLMIHTPPVFPIMIITFIKYMESTNHLSTPPPPHFEGILPLFCIQSTNSNNIPNIVEWEMFLYKHPHQCSHMSTMSHYLMTPVVVDQMKIMCFVFTKTVSFTTIQSKYIFTKLRQDCWSEALAMMHTLFEYHTTDTSLFFPNDSQSNEDFALVKIQAPAPFPFADWHDSPTQSTEHFCFVDLIHNQMC